MLQARGTQQPAPVTELCRWLHRPVKVTTKQGGGGVGTNIHTGTPTQTHQDALKLKYTPPLLKKMGGSKYSCCSSQ